MDQLSTRRNMLALTNISVFLDSCMSNNVNSAMGLYFGGHVQPKTMSMEAHKIIGIFESTSRL